MLFITIEYGDKTERVMEVITMGDPLLRRRSILVNDIDRGVQDFIQAMFEIMHAGDGIGLAAVQAGHLHRIFITHVPRDKPRIFINPEITQTSLGQVKYEEGCLSVPGINSEVMRPSDVRIQAWDERGRPFTLNAENLLARAIQHELDHLNGKLFIDHLDPKKRGRILGDYNQKVHV